MLVFHALLGLAFATFFFGLLWRHRSPDLDVASAFVGYMAKALTLTWIITFLSFILSIGQGLRYLVYAVALVLILRTFLHSSDYTIRSSPLTKWGYYRLSPIMLGLIFFALTVYQMMSGYHLIFAEWDAVVSWNRWAIELSQQFYSSGSAYPVFVPGLWSFIYQMQGTTEIWIFAKLILPLSVVMMLGYGLLLMYEGRSIMGLCVVASVGLLVTTLGQAMTSGYMDAPVTLFILFGYLLIIDALRKQGAASFPERLLFGTLMLGLAAATKQPGTLALLPAGVLLLFLKRDGQLTVRQLVGLMITMVIPLGLYLIIFFGQEGTQSLIGNIGHLRSLTEARTGANQVFDALNLLFSVYHPGIVAALGVVGAFSIWAGNVAFRVLAITSFTTFVVGFLGYAECCAYSARNAYWLVALLVVPAAISIVYLFELKDVLSMRSIIQRKVVQSQTVPILLSTIGALALLASLLVTPQLIAVNLSPDGTLEQKTVAQINTLRSVVRYAGVIILGGSLLMKFLPELMTRAFTGLISRIQPDHTISFERVARIPRWRMAIGITFVMLGVPGLISTAISGSDVYALQEQRQATLGGKGNSQLVMEHTDKLGEKGLILSRNQTLAYNSRLPKWFAYCKIRMGSKDKCTYWRQPGNSSTYETFCERSHCAPLIAERFPNSLFLAELGNARHVVREFAETKNTEIQYLGRSGYVLLWIRQTE